MGFMGFVGFFLLGLILNLLLYIAIVVLDRYFTEKEPIWIKGIPSFLEIRMYELNQENQNDAIAVRKMAQPYENQMKREQEAGQQRAVAISQAYVRKVEEITRSEK